MTRSQASTNRALRMFVIYLTKTRDQAVVDLMRANTGAEPDGPFCG